MNTAGCNSLQVSTQIAVDIAGVPSNLSNAFAAAPSATLLNQEVVTVPVGASPVPLGAVPDSSIGFLYVQNLEIYNPLYLSTNADGSLPFACIGAGRHTILPAMPGQLYYFRADSSTIAALILVLAC